MRPLGQALVAGLLGMAAASAAEAPAEAPLTFNRDIRPILSDNCFACHGTDAKQRKAGLRLDTAEGAFTPNKHGTPAIRPGDAEGSELWKRLITGDPDDLMPPPDSHKSLTPAQKATLRQWIEQGASYQRHWSFEPIVLPPVPLAVAGEPPAANPVDRFIEDRLAREHWTLSPEADRRTLIRRLSFDLRGLPPSVAEVEAFVSDPAPDAYARLVERFLDSPDYGEQMARHWLDVARYGDTHGLHLDNERSMWPYRDWVVGAFNRNLPFDQFTIEQLAGDLLPDPTREQLTATGFNRCNVTTGEGGAIDAEFIFRYAVDRTSTTAETWLGLTAGCAVCHDHKFDPLPTREFYSLYAFFLSAADPAMDGNSLLTAPTIKLPQTTQEQRLAGFDAQIQAAEARVREALPTVSYTDPATLTPPPPVEVKEVVWLDDEAPGTPKAATENGPRWIGPDQGPVRAGQRALRRQGPGVTQDVFESNGAVLEIPAGATLFAHVFLDPKDPPKAVMLQFNKDGWDHRAIWGDADAIDWGEKGKAGRMPMGDLPRTGEWIRLEVPAERVGLKAGDRLSGIAFTQADGTGYWDQAGVQGRVDPANDPLHSFAVWQRQYDGKEPGEVPQELRTIFKNSSITNRAPEDATRLRNHYLSTVCAATRPVFEPLQREVARLRKERGDYDNAIAATFIFRDLEKPRDAFVMMRGQYDKPGEKVLPGMPAALSTARNASAANSDAAPRLNRLDLARWLVSPDQPLTARVTVNRFWQQFFGTGIV
ncbi:MAG: DUF1549 domain-containing protein, partial [Verrucomicrobia bacterium]|nr:DUF1549 domain-containing protein [Verrucomicrobiota bacterium]